MRQCMYKSKATMPSCPRTKYPVRGCHSLRSRASCTHAKPSVRAHPCSHAGESAAAHRYAHSSRKRAREHARKQHDQASPAFADTENAECQVQRYAIPSMREHTYNVTPHSQQRVEEGMLKKEWECARKCTSQAQRARVRAYAHPQLALLKVVARSASVVGCNVLRLWFCRIWWA